MTPGNKHLTVLLPPRQRYQYQSHGPTINNQKLVTLQSLARSLSLGMKHEPDCCSPTGVKVTNDPTCSLCAAD